MTCQNCGNQVAANLNFCPKCGTPASAPSYTPPPAEPVVASWSQNPDFAVAPTQPKRKSRVGKVLLIIGAILLLLVAGAGVAGYFGYKYVERKMKSSEAFKIAEERLRESAEVKARMGEIKSTGFPIGNFTQHSDGSGNAAFTVSVEGEKASGRYSVTMERERSTWRIERAFVQLADGDMITVVHTMNTGSAKPGNDNDNTNDNDNDNTNLNTNESNTNQSKQKPLIMPGDTLEARLVSKPEPTYPPVAKAARAEGNVTVQVLVDEEGKVISASATSGHPLLRASAVAAARQARFDPTLVAGKPVRVSGTLTYEFSFEE
jgi:TonB family protein